MSESAALQGAGLTPLTATNPHSVSSHLPPQASLLPGLQSRERQPPDPQTPGAQIPGSATTIAPARAPGTRGAERHALARRQPCPLVSPPPDSEEPAYLPLSNTTDRVLRILLEGDLSRLRAENVAETLGISCTTLRRRLRNDHTRYQFLLDRARQYRCEARLRERWLPGKCLADELGYLEINSFYRAFRRWTGLSYSEYKLRFH